MFTLFTFSARKKLSAAKFLLGQHIPTIFLVGLSLALVSHSPAQENVGHPPSRLAQDLHCLAALGVPGPEGPLGILPAAFLLSQERQQQAFWESVPLAQPAAAAEMVLERNPFTLVLMRIKARDWVVWHEPLAPDLAPELTAEWLDKVRDNKAMPDFRGKPLGKRRPEEVAVYNAYCEAVANAHEVPLEAFMKSAEDYKFVTFAHLWTDSDKYRGKVIPLQGRLLRVRQIEAPLQLQDRGIKFIFEGWIKGPTKDSTPFVVIFPELAEDKTSPTGLLEPAENMDRAVTFYGYYFKKFRYPVELGTGPQKKTVDRSSPLLIGPTVILTQAAPPPTPSEPAISADLFAFLFGFALVVVTLMVGLSWWFRRGDRQFHQRVSQLHNQQALDMLENVDKEPNPSESNDSPKNP
jgi:hypothetical protein